MVYYIYHLFCTNVKLLEYHKLDSACYYKLVCQYIRFFAKPIELVVVITKPIELVVVITKPIKLVMVIAKPIELVVVITKSIELFLATCSLGV